MDHRLAVLSLVVLGVVLLVGAVAWPGGVVRCPEPPRLAGGQDGLRELGRPAGRDHHGQRQPPRPRRHPGRRARLRLQGDLADAVALVAAPLRAGVPPAGAVRAAAEALDPGAALAEPMRGLHAAAARGDSLAQVWLDHAEMLDSADLRFVGRAWLLSERTGAPLAEALARAEEVLRSRHRARQRLASAAAGPRASMAVLAALPLTGPLMGLAFGLGPGDLYLATPASTVSLLAGAALALGAWQWSRRIVAAALRSGAARSGSADHAP